MSRQLRGERHPAIFGRRADRVAPLSLVAVVRGEADVDVLARSVPGPIRNVEDDGPDARVSSISSTTSPSVQLNRPDTEGLLAIAVEAAKGVSRLSTSPFDELLATVDVEDGASDRRVRHQADGERGDVGRANDASDRQRRTQLRAAGVESIAENRRRQRRVDGPGRDHVHADGRELEGELLRYGAKGAREPRDELEPLQRAAATCAPEKQESPPGRTARAAF